MHKKSIFFMGGVILSDYNGEMRDKKIPIYFQVNFFYPPYQRQKKKDMKNKNNYSLTTNEANAIPFKDLLGALGYYPIREEKRGNELWYFSPLRAKEKDASFKVDVKKNLWYDFGGGIREKGDKKGFVLDFIMMYRNCSVSEAFSFLSSLRITKCHFVPQKLSSDNRIIDYQITSEKPLKDKTYCSYVSGERGINIAIAQKYLIQVTFKKYEGQKKDFFGLGMLNKSGGYEIRPIGKIKGYERFSDNINKDITLFRYGYASVSIFEGFFDLLALLTMKGIYQLKSDVIILHGVGNLSSAVNEIRQLSYSKIYSFFDNDFESKTGDKITNDLFELFGSKVKDMRYLYKGFKDINDKLLNKPLKEKHHTM